MNIGDRVIWACSECNYTEVYHTGAIIEIFIKTGEGQYNTNIQYARIKADDDEYIGEIEAVVPLKQLEVFKEGSQWGR
jgi:hypothetical protein